MTKEDFLEKIKSVARAETSFDPDGWTAENPLWGHCAVVSLSAQELFGGDLVQGSLKEYPKYSYSKSHIWNRIDGMDVDFTAEQYQDISYKDLKGEVVSRESTINYPGTQERFDLLKDKLMLGKNTV